MGACERLEKPPEQWTVTIAEPDGARLSARRNAALETWSATATLPVRLTVDLVPLPDPRVAPHARVQDLDAFEGRLLSGIRDHGVAAMIVTDGRWRQITCYVDAEINVHTIHAEAAAILRHHGASLTVEKDAGWAFFRRADIERPAAIETLALATDPTPPPVLPV